MNLKISTFFKLLSYFPLLICFTSSAGSSIGDLPNYSTKIAKSVYKIIGKPCSGFFSSSSGYFITNLHCIQKMILNEGPVLEGVFLESLYAYAWKVKDRTSRFQFNQIDDVREFKLSIAQTEPESIFLGSGYIQTRPILETPSKDFQSGNTPILSLYSEDFAILKFKVNEKVPCLNVSKEKFIGTNEPVSSYGYSRVSPYNLEYELKTKTIKAYSNVIDMTSELNNKEQNEISLFDSNKVFFFAQNDIRVGMSGGPILDKDNRVIGINTLSIDSYGVATDMGYILSQYAKYAQNLAHLPSVNEVFKCEDNSN